MRETRAAIAQATYNPMHDGVSIIVSPEPNAVIHWGDPTVVRTPPEASAMEPPTDAYLRIPEHVARAMYEALGRYFGGDAVDARRLRQDYDAERKRVDKFIDAAIARQP
jgi:hypothetical protein